MKPTSLLLLSVAAIFASAVLCTAQGPAVKPLVDLSRPDTVHFTTQNKAKAEISEGTTGGKVLKVTCPAGKGYPGVQVRPHAAGKDGPTPAWNLTGKAWIAARVHNPTDHELRVFLRADNPGDWRTGPWNTQPTSVPAGSGRRFGRSPTAARRAAWTSGSGGRCTTRTARAWKSTSWST
jgi:hypothetical protein